MEIHGPAALIVIDVQKGELPQTASTGIPVMAGGAERHARIRELVDAARSAEVPVIFIQEVHKPSGRDFGRELDGAEGPHCIEGDTETELAISPRPDEYHIRKRRYSAFFATELDLVLRNLGIRTLVLVGALTDVCVHYTAVDAHQHDYHFRVVHDCVGGSTIPAHEAALRAMTYLQRDAVIDSEQALQALRRPVGMLA
jgi:nicotinamidase-related amidase